MHRKPDVNQLPLKIASCPLAANSAVRTVGSFWRNTSPGRTLRRPMPNSFPKKTGGSPAKSSRLALGALILQERLGMTDRELVEQIAENPYLQSLLSKTAETQHSEINIYAGFRQEWAIFKFVPPVLSKTR
jgi:transposase, IS5 family